MSEKKKSRRGGKREGAGRPPKAPATELGELSSEDPMAFLEGVMNNGKVEDSLRVRAAITLAQYRYAKAGDSGKKGAAQDAANTAAQGRFAPAAPPKLIRVK